MTSSPLQCRCLLAALSLSLGVVGQAPFQRNAQPGLQSFALYRVDDDTVRAEGSRYEAEFVAGRAQLAASSATLQLRYLGARRGQASWQCDPRAQPQLVGDRVHFDHGDIVEAYAVGEHGFEQSFRIDQRPQGAGDLLLQISVTGNVSAEACVAAHRALEFTYEDRRAIRYGEAFVFERGGEPVDVLTSYDGNGCITLTVPAAFLDRATFPVVVDPAVTPVFDPGFGGSNYNDSDSDVAHDLASDRYMVVWTRTTSTGNTYWRGRIYDRDGTSPSPLVSFYNLGKSPSVAACRALNTNAFLAVWEHDNRIFGQLVRASDAALLGGSFAISSVAPGQEDHRPTVSGTGDGVMMVAWDRTVAGNSNPSEIVVRALSWTDPAQPTSVIASAEELLDSFSPTAGYVQNVELANSDVRVTFSGQFWYANRAVWERFYALPAPGDTDVWTSSFRFRPSPTPFAFAVIDSPSAVPGAAGIGFSEIQPDIAGRASRHQDPIDEQYLVVWEDERDVRGNMFDLDGPIGSPIEIRATGDYEGYPAVGAGFCEFTVAYLERTSPNEFDLEVYAARVLLDGTVATDHVLVDDPGNVFQTDISVSSRPIDTATGQETNRALITWTGQTGPAGLGLNDIRARYYEPVGANLLPFGSACPGPLGELPTIGTTGGLPFAGNEDFEVTVDGAPINTIGALVVSDQLTTTPIPGAPGCFLYAGLPLLNVLPTVVSGAGFGSVDVPIPCSIPSGTTLAFQWAIYSPTANAFGWIVSDDLDVSWSH